VADKSSFDAVTRVLRETAHSQLSAPVSASFVPKIRSFGLSYRESHPDAPIALEPHAAIRSWQSHSFTYTLFRMPIASGIQYLYVRYRHVGVP
jgi:hypothetical protein